MEDVRSNFKNAKTLLDGAKTRLKEIRQYSYEDWKNHGKQITLDEMIAEME
jgi:hypothetical protein